MTYLVWLNHSLCMLLLSNLIIVILRVLFSKENVVQQLSLDCTHQMKISDLYTFIPFVINTCFIYTAIYTPLF